jgi:hypothetical protein
MKQKAKYTDTIVSEDTRGREFSEIFRQNAETTLGLHGRQRLRFVEVCCLNLANQLPETERALLLLTLYETFGFPQARLEDLRERHKKLLDEETFKRLMSNCEQLFKR